MKQYITNHANERYFERLDQSVTRKEILKFINNGGQIHYAKKLSNTKSLAYLEIKEEVIKIIINRKTKKLISILPFNDVHKHKIELCKDYFGPNKWKIILYPDCYNESNNIHALNKIYEVTDDSIIKLEYDNPLFNKIFDLAWKIHKGSQNGETNSKIQETVITKRETIQ